jgi:hypothetical protein
MPENRFGNDGEYWLSQRIDLGIAENRRDLEEFREI